MPGSGCGTWSARWSSPVPSACCSPRLSGLAALGLVGLLVGATATNLLVIDQGPWLPLGLPPVNALVAWARWPQTKTLAGTRRR